MTNTGPTQTERPRDWGILREFLIPAEDVSPDLPDQVRSLVAHYPELPAAWAVGSGELDPKFGDELTNLQFGITASTETGVLSWIDEDARVQFRPASGTNTEEVEYRMPGMHIAWFGVGTVVPAELVYAAVAEYLRTRERPTCVEWVPIDAG
jgi:hypothetical protein